MLRNTEALRDKPIIVARARSAWQSAEVIVKAAVKAEDEPLKQEDLDTPLSDTTKEELDKAWDIRYHLVIELRLTPPDSLVARRSSTGQWRPEGTKRDGTVWKPGAIENFPGIPLGVHAES